MIRAINRTFVLATLAALSACSAPQRGPSNEVINRVLVGVPGEAQPSTIVATELAYARAAQSEGQYTAGLAYAASGALLHGSNGTVDGIALYTRLSNPKTSVAWGPRTIMMSCDGAVAISLGRFRDQEAQVGNYVTVWQRQPDRQYRWVYDVAGRDNPQPPPRPEFEDGDIVVTAIDAVEGLIADCPQRRGNAAPPPPALSLSSDHPQGSTLSGDGTLRWRWEHRPDGIKYFAAEYFYQGEWRTAIEESLTSPPES